MKATEIMGGRAGDLAQITNTLSSVGFSCKKVQIVA
jgi:hypothetical protein